MEEWKQIKDYQNYSVSNFGNVKNNSTYKNLKPIIDYWGYPRVNLYNDNGVKMFKIHQLVYSHFANNFEKKIIDHIDRNKENNNFDNLRVANVSLNALNQDKKINRTSKYRCCYFDRKLNKFAVRINVNNKKVFVGSYPKELDAGLAYNKYIIDNRLVNGFRKFNLFYQNEIQASSLLIT